MSSLKIKKVLSIGLLSAISIVISFLSFPIFFFPGSSVYKLDFSDAIVLVSGLTLGPTSGVVVEFLKNLIRFFIKGSSSFGIGEVSNFFIGTSFVLSSSLIYKHFKGRQNDIVISLSVGSICMVFFSVLINFIFSIPVYELITGVKLNMFTDQNIFLYTIFVLSLFNLIKAISCGLVCGILFKRMKLFLRYYIE